MGTGSPAQKYWDGLAEDSLMPRQDPNQGLADMQPNAPENPGPGELGYSPITRIQG